MQLSPVLAGTLWLFAVAVSAQTTQVIKSPSAVQKAKGGASVSVAAALAEAVQVQNAWARTAVTGQSGTGAYMTLTAKTATKLVGVSSPLAGTAEVHETKMQDDLMTMRRVGVLDLPAGKPVALRPGSYHLMLMDLKQALPPGSVVPLTLSFKNAKGVESQLTLQVPVAVTAPMAANESAMPQGHRH